MEPPSLRLPPSSTKGSWAKQDDERQTTVRRGGNDGPSDGVMALPCDETDVGVVRPLLRLGDGGVGFRPPVLLTPTPSPSPIEPHRLGRIRLLAGPSCIPVNGRGLRPA